MKKLTKIIVGAILIGAGIIALSDNSAAAFKGPVGNYQCTICGMRSRINSNSSVLCDKDILGDGHTHNWRYLGNR